jgi:hypothetical protein
MLLCAGCTLFDPEEPLPAYLIIPEFNLVTNPITEGTNSEAISEVWVYVNAQMVGAYEVPATIPVLDFGAKSVQIFAGVKNNDNPRSRLIYPFYLDHVETVDFQPLKYDTIVPEFRYRPNSTIRLVDDFEAANVFIIDVSSQGSMERSNDADLVFEGNRSLHVSLNEDETIVRIKTNEQQYNLPQNRLCYLEVNYRTDNSVAVGLEANGNFGSRREFSAILNPRANGVTVTEWRKIYVDLAGITSIFPSATYEVVFECVKDPGNTTANFWLDNIKIVHF